MDIIKLIGSILTTIFVGIASIGQASPTVRPSIQLSEQEKPVICKIPTQCGGGTKTLRKWECDTAVCCNTNGKWEFYYDGRKCETPKPAPAIKQTQPQQATVGNQIDCTGPDGKHLWMTQKACDDFNAAWGKKITNSPTQSANFYCWNNTYQQGYYTTSGEQCNLDNQKSRTGAISRDQDNAVRKINYDNCLNQAKNNLDQCNNTCEGPYNYGRDACNYAVQNLDWETSTYQQCLDENSRIWDDCSKKCQSDYQKSLSSCTF